jgi:hypothetical protein
LPYFYFSWQFFFSHIFHMALMASVQICIFQFSLNITLSFCFPCGVLSPQPWRLENINCSSLHCSSCWTLRSFHHFNLINNVSKNVLAKAFSLFWIFLLGIDSSEWKRSQRVLGFFIIVALRGVLYTHWKAAFWWALWHIPVIPALGRQRQEDHKFEANLGYIERPRPAWATQRKTRARDIA